MQTGLLQGRNSMELARAVQKRFDVSRSDAERLMMTEMRRVRTEVAKQSYEQNGNTEYQFLALGARPCDKCLDIDGQVFPVKEMMPGVNAPPCTRGVSVRRHPIGMRTSSRRGWTVAPRRTECRGRSLRKT